MTPLEIPVVCSRKAAKTQSGQELLRSFQKDFFASSRLCVNNFFMTENELSRLIVDSAFRIHSDLGPGLFESVYEATMAHELSQRGCRITCQKAIPVVYDQVKLNIGFRADIIVNNKVIVEIKSVEGLARVHGKQLTCV